jgi:hypothetical protein
MLIIQLITIQPAPGEGEIATIPTFRLQISATLRQDSPDLTVEDLRYAPTRLHDCKTARLSEATDLPTFRRTYYTLRSWP